MSLECQNPTDSSRAGILPLHSIKASLRFVGQGLKPCSALEPGNKMFTSWIISPSLAECMAGNSRAILNRGQKGLEGLDLDLDLSPCSLKVLQIPAPESPREPLPAQGNQALNPAGLF